MKRFQELFTQNIKHQTGSRILSHCPCGSSASLPCVGSVMNQLLEKPKECSKLQLQQEKHAQSTQQHPTNEQIGVESSLAEPAHLYSSSNQIHLSNHDLSRACSPRVAAWHPLKRQTGPVPFGAVTKHLTSLFKETFAVQLQGCLQRPAYTTKTKDHTSGHTDGDTGKKESSVQQNDDETEKLDPALQVMASSTASSALKTVKVVPGKGPPPEPPITCCMTGCPNCVWILYAEELKKYYNDGGLSAKKEIEKIEDPSLKAFIKFELGIK